MDDKLKNILKLKEELEKDLKKKGLIKKIEKRSGSGKGKDSISKELREKIMGFANILPEKSYSIFDINSQDYDADIESVKRTLKKFSAESRDLWKVNIYNGLIELLDGNFKVAFEKFKESDHFIGEYNAILSELYDGKNVAQEILNFIKQYPKSIYPYLLLLEYELSQGNSNQFSRILNILEKMSKVFAFVKDVYMKKKNEESLKFMIREKLFIPLIFLFNAYISGESPDKFQSKHTCLAFHKSYLKGDYFSKIPKYCVKGNMAVAAKSYLSGKEIDLDFLNLFAKTPEYKLFFGFYYYNKNEKDKAKKFFEDFENSVEFFEIHVKELKDKKVGIRQFFQFFTGSTIVKMGIFSALEKFENKDLFVHYYDSEMIRLLFSEKHCKSLYGEGNK
ncbi:hypothetical protein JYK00_04875 [Thermosipho ferrireducens]|uniref:Uncharacterized protein n=1 Tax=Thermosipho ferrireducens TaxID=2571116 RepID=A0ABX7S8C2_9BACT|nr:hypothetical protein [Thermosipho ferrireducens]QTA38842.1 hypothetical protein JYK00_04875 [Thermosipho ferrireducens]